MAAVYDNDGKAALSAKNFQTREVYFREYQQSLCSSATRLYNFRRLYIFIEGSRAINVSR